MIGRCVLCDADLVVRTDVVIRNDFHRGEMLFCGPCYRTLEDRVGRRVLDKLARIDAESTGCG